VIRSLAAGVVIQQITGGVISVSIRAFCPRVEQNKHAALVRVSVISRLLAQTLDELEIEMPTAQLAQELTTLGERAESELSQPVEDRH
jgi:hypothetical protein